MRRVRRRQSRLGMLLVMVVMVVVVAASMMRTFSLNEKSRDLAITEHSLEQELAAVQQESVNLDNLEKYMLTKKYIEDEAKDKLGLVYPDEIVIKPNED